MKIIKVTDYDQMSKKAAELIIEKVRENPKLNIGLATGRTPEGMYRNLVEDHQRSGTSYKNITTFNLDEYVGLHERHQNSYRHYMKSKLFNHINIPNSNTHIPRGDVEDLEEECRLYDKLIGDKGGIDLQVLGIGRNGHIGFNEPGSSFLSTTHIVQLTPSTRKANAKYFSGISEVPTHAITMGIGTIMKSKKILLLVSGSEKQEAVKRLLTGNVSPDFPASILNQHPNVTVIGDEAAISDMI